MADLLPRPPDPPNNGVRPAAVADPHPSEPAPTTASAAAVTTVPTSKRQRRPSVRLGDIGEQPAASDPFIRRPKHFRPGPSIGAARGTTRNPNPSPSSFKTRILTHLDPLPEPSDDPEANLETLAASIRGQNPKYLRRGRKARSGWTSAKPEDDEDEGFRSEFDDLRREGSLSPSDRDRVRHDPHSEPEAREWTNNGNLGLDEEGGIRSWLNRLGLGRYAPVFEIHEVDDEVLPLLTLEDLKDMGINAVGSRRKLYCAIQKLKKNFT